jgi:hypothetical protein
MSPFLGIIGNTIPSNRDLTGGGDEIEVFDRILEMGGIKRIIDGASAEDRETEGAL